MKENILGSNSGIEYPHWEHEKLEENKCKALDSISSISIKPSDRKSDVSTDSDILDLISFPDLITNLSITAEILCFLFFSKSGNSSIGYTIPLTLTLTYPLFLNSSYIPRCSPFLSLITGAIIMIFEFIFSFKISSHISETVLAFNSSLWSGHLGVPILENNNLK